MKFFLFLILVVFGDFSTASGKSHHGRTHQHGHGVITPNPNEPLTLNEGDQKSTHELTNRVSPDALLRQDHVEPPKSMASQLANASATPSSVARPQVPPTEKRNALHSNAEEHNVNKKQLDDQDGIPMETEYLIHVTPSPPTGRKGKKLQGQKRRSQTTPEEGKVRKGPKDPSETAVKLSHRNKQKPHNSTSIRKDATSGTKGAKRNGKGAGKANKNRKYPKKFNPQKHALKKTQKEKKDYEKNKEKRDKLKEKREKRKKMKTNHKPEENNN